MTAKDIAWIPVNLVQLLWLGLFTAFCFPVVMLSYLITWNPDTGLAVARVFWGPVNLAFGFSTMHVEGRENIPVGKPYILMMNHESMGDIMAAWMITPTPVRFIAKHILLFVPVVGWVIWIFNMVSIDRGDAHSTARALKKAARVLREGLCLCAFPEGTRSRDGSIGPFKKGVFLLALKAGVPIIPVAATGLGTFAPRDGWHPRPARIKVRVGQPIPTDAAGLDRDTLIRQVRDAMIDMHVALGGKGGDKANAVADPRAH